MCEWAVPGVEATWCAAKVGDSEFLGHLERHLVTPASTMKVSIALAVESAIVGGAIDGTQRICVPVGDRTPGPVGMSLMSDSVEMSIRDLLVPMLTISDNVATDALLAVIGIDTVNAMTEGLGMTSTRIATDLASMLNDMAVECGFSDYRQLEMHDSRTSGAPSRGQLSTAIGTSRALDPSRGTRTCAADMVQLMLGLWDGSAGPERACRRVRKLMEQQLTRTRIASGFGPGWDVAAKSGGLMGIVRNEVGVVTTPSGDDRFAIAIFTRREPSSDADPADIDSAIGSLARTLVEHLR